MGGGYVYKHDFMYCLNKTYMIYILCFFSIFCPDAHNLLFPFSRPGREKANPPTSTELKKTREKILVNCTPGWLDLYSYFNSFRELVSPPFGK